MSKNLFIVVCVGIVVGAIAFVIGYDRGRIRERGGSLQQEFLWTHVSLGANDLSPQMHEYLKAKLYHCTMYMSVEEIQRLPNADFGRVDDAVLGSVRPAPPHADSPNSWYSALKERSAGRLK